MSYDRKSNGWKRRSPLSELIVRALKKLRIRTDPRWTLLLVVLFLVLLCGCASIPVQCPPPSRPPPALMIEPPPAGAMTDRLEAILQQGRTLAPSSTTSPAPVTPKTPN